MYYVAKRSFVFTESQDYIVSQGTIFDVISSVEIHETLRRLDDGREFRDVRVKPDVFAKAMSFEEAQQIADSLRQYSWQEPSVG